MAKRISSDQFLKIIKSQGSSSFPKPAVTPNSATPSVKPSSSRNFRLDYPATNATKDEATIVACNRFLLDEFPSRIGASAGDKPATRAIKCHHAPIHRCHPAPVHVMVLHSFSLGKKAGKR